MDQTRFGAVGERNPSGREGGCVGVALVAQGVVLRGDHHCGRESGQVGFEQRADPWVGASCRIGDPLLGEPARVVGVEAPPGALGLHARPGQGQVRVGVGEHLHGRLWLTGVAQGQTTQRGEIPAQVDLEATSRLVNGLTIVVGDSQMLPYLNTYFQMTDEQVQPDRLLDTLVEFILKGLS